MKKFTIIYSPKAYGELKNLDKNIALRITDKIEIYVYKTANPFEHAKALVGIMSGLYRYRVGDYRVIFELEWRLASVYLCVGQDCSSKNV